MPTNDPLADRINKLAENKASQKQAEAAVAVTEQQALEFLYSNAAAEFERLLQIIQRRVHELNPQLTGVPPYAYEANPKCVVQGKTAAYLTYSQMFTNTGQIHLQISFGAQPRAYYIERSAAPNPERYLLQPAVEHSPLKIIWLGDLGQNTSEALADFILQHLTEYYLENP